MPYHHYETYRCKQHDVLDNICIAHYGDTLFKGSKIVEMVLSANAGLADHGTHLPMGLVIKLPEFEPQPRQKSAVNLWD